MNEKAEDEYEDTETLKTAKRLRVPVLGEREEVIKAKLLGADEHAGLSVGERACEGHRRRRAARQFGNCG